MSHTRYCFCGLQFGLTNLNGCQFDPRAAGVDFSDVITLAQLRRFEAQTREERVGLDSEGYGGGGIMQLASTDLQRCSQPAALRRRKLQRDLY